MLHNGAPFYPFGFYYDGYNIDKATRLADLNTMATAGFNVVATNIDNADGPLFTQAASTGLSVLMEFNDSNDTILQQVDRWKNNPALLGWQVSDDVDNGRKTPDSVRAQHLAIKAADPAHITYVSGGHPSPGTGHDVIGNYMDVSDTIAMQSYPIPSEAVSATNATFDKFYDAAPANKSLIGNVQSFKWEDENRPPTPEEARLMTCLAYINGMKGIIYYTFRADYWNLPASTALWDQFKVLAQENTVMRPWLLNGTLVRQVDTGAQRFNVFCSYWLYQGKLYIMFANVSNSNRSVSITLPAPTNGPADTLFPGTAEGMTFNNTTKVISGTVQKGKVHIYQLSHVQAGVPDWTLY